MQQKNRRYQIYFVACRKGHKILFLQEVFDGEHVMERKGSRRKEAAGSGFF